ncbi:CDT1-like protein b [Nymphaea colorata]|nr:CDT1-like protein b [Nymphaea colorata]
MELRSRKISEGSAAAEIRSLKISKGSNKGDQTMDSGMLGFISKKELACSEVGISSYCENPQSSDPSSALQTPQKPATSRPNRRYARSVEDVRRIAKSICVEKKDCEVQCKSSVKVAKRKPMVKLPSKYEGLCNQFDSMVSSIRLLKLKGYASTFANICSSVQALTNKGFSQSQLAQLKYLMPEAIDIRTTLVQDEKTSCVKSELLVALQPDALKDSILGVNGDSYLALSTVVRSRLSTFIKSRPEGDEIPEETLPEPFNQRTQSILSEATLNNQCGTEKNSVISSASSSPIETPAQLPLGCFTSSFQKRFSQRAIFSKSEKTQLLSLTTPNSSDVEDISNAVSSPPNTWRSSAKHVAASNLTSFSIERLSRFSTCTDSNLEKNSMHCQGLYSTPLAPSKMKSEPCSHAEEFAGSEVGLSQIDCTPARLMSNTPDPSTPKRAKMTPESNATPCIKAPRHMIKRTLNFPSPVHSMEKERKMRRFSLDEDIVRSLPSTLLQSLEAKEKMRVENEAAIPEANLHQKMIKLPKLFDMIYLIFQSAKCSVLTKQELLFKITTQNLDIVDQRETEEQLKLLVELIPDWICGKKASSGDSIFCINKIADPESLRARLVEAGKVGS